jgi:hypothetical protein
MRIRGRTTTIVMTSGKTTYTAFAISISFLNIVSVRRREINATGNIINRLSFNFNTLDNVSLRMNSMIVVFI